MPLYTRECMRCEVRFDVLRNMGKRDEPVPCKTCKGETRRGVALIASTPSGWGDSTWSGRFDKGLGITLRSKAHRDQVMKERGLVETTAYDQRAKLDKGISLNNEHERTMSRYNSELSKANGDKGLAIANTFPSDT